MGARQDLADKLTDLLPATVKIIADTRELGELEGDLTGACQLVRQRLASAGRVGAWLQTFDLWVILPRTSADNPQELDDALDELVDSVAESLAGHDWLLWTEAEHENHPSGYPAYRIPVTVASNSTN